MFLVILLTAAYLRFQSLSFNMPTLAPEEYDYLLGILYLKHHFLNPNITTVPNFFLYLNSIVLFLSQTLDTSFILNALEVSPGNIYFSLRLLNVFFDLGSVIIIFLIGNLFSKTCGLFASGFFAVSLLNVLFSKLFLPFSGMVFFSLLSTLFALFAITKGKNNYLFLATIFSILSTSMHYVGAVSIIPVLFCCCLIKEKKLLRFYLVLFFISFLVLNPFFIFHIFSFFKNIFEGYGLSYHLHHDGSSLLYLINFPLLSTGPVVWISAFFLFKYQKCYDRTLLKILFSAPIFYFALIGFLHLTKSVYATLLIPYFCLASSLVFSLLIKERREDFIFLVLIVLAFYIPFKYTYKLNKLISLSDTRSLATEWIKSHTSLTFKIAWDKNSLQIKNKQHFLLTTKLLTRKDWFKTLKKKIDYVVINSLDSEIMLRSKNNLGLKKFYTKMLKLKPDVIFDPYLAEEQDKVRSFLIEDLYLPIESLWFRERTGPIIRIYKL